MTATITENYHKDYYDCCESLCHFEEYSFTANIDTVAATASSFIDSDNCCCWYY